MTRDYIKDALDNEPMTATPHPAEITLVLGGSGGLGQAVMARFPGAVDWSLKTNVDVTNGHSLNKAVMRLSSPVTRIVNCVGVNLLRGFDSIVCDDFFSLMHTNAFSIVNVVQWLRDRELLKAGAAICNVVSNAAHIPMTHSLIYNASKAAAEMITRQMARELKEYTIFAVNPNKLAGTGMSRQIESEVCKLREWTPEEAQRYQLAALPAGVETPPESLAAFIAELMRPIHHPFITGCVFPYGGPQG